MRGNPPTHFKQEHSYGLEFPRASLEGWQHAVEVLPFDASVHLVVVGIHQSKPPQELTVVLSVAIIDSFIG